MNSYLDFALETERMSIRAWRIEDAEAAFEMYSDPEVAEYLTGVPEESLESQRDYLSRIIGAYSKLDAGMGSFPLIEKETGSLVGAVLLKPLPRTEDIEAWRAFREDPSAIPPIHEIEIGWHLAKRHWGKGFATESARRMLDYGFNDLGLEEVHAVLYSGNRRSKAVVKRLGMRHLGSTERFYGVEVEHYVTP